MRRKYETRTKAGSALILAVVLTSLLAIVGVMFVMAARVDRISTSAISENKELNFAVETIVSKISQKLASDVPGGITGLEYYDYPDSANPWLASLEPEVDDNGIPADANDDIYYWRHVSDINEQLGPQDGWNLSAGIIDDYQEPVGIGDSNIVNHYPADADGDGVSDSMWIRLGDITTGKGRPIYAAVRIIDNGAMLNVNTAYKFDPGGTDPNLIDGSRLAQVHLLNFEKGITDDVNDVHRFRCDGNEPDMLTFNDECAIRIENPDRTNINYLPYDTGDELELRNRYVLDAQYNTTRIEAALPITLTYPKGTTFGNRFAPIDSSDDFSDWKKILNPFDPNDSYNFRHLLTTYNMDRIINPAGDKMLCINDPDPNVSFIYDAIRAGLYGGGMADSNSLAAQLAVNLKDFRDADPCVSAVNDVEGNRYYGFEAQPFITEIGMKVVFTPSSIDYAVELYNPFSQPIGLEDFVLELTYSAEPDRVVSFGPGDIIDANSCFVIASDLTAFGVVDKQDPNLNFFGSWKPVDPSLPPGPGPPGSPPSAYPDANGILLLKRDVGDPNWVYVDRQEVDKQVVDPNTVPPSGKLYFGRDVRDWHIVYQTLEASASSLGSRNNIDPNQFTGHNFSFFLPNPLDPNREFITVGDIPRILKIGPGVEPNSTIGQQLGLWGTNEEYEVRLDLQDPNHRNVFQYLTVFDPSTDYINNDGDPNTDEIDLDKTPELKIPGRININTAPWYVIAQLPWVSGELAQAIVAYRDKTVVVGRTDPNYTDQSFIVNPDGDGRFLGTELPGLREMPGFASIGELATVINSAGENYYDMRHFALDPNDLDGFPDLTPGDGIVDDFEERDVIFSRISNLVTVRSDVFTAYILVRIGTDGPQKRVMAILDRSDVYPDAGRVKVRALHPVPDPR